METLVVRGGRPLVGTVSIHGAKNGALPLLAASLLCPDDCTICGCPEISDVACAAEILTYLGCRVRRRKDVIRIDAADCSGCCIPQELSGRMRGSLIFLGALLARHGCAEISAPGGCVLGQRPIDYHVGALQTLGVIAETDDTTMRFSWPARRGGTVKLPFPSVGATENLMLAATGVPDVVVIHGAAREPEIAELGRFLRAMGAEIEGEGSPTVTICGGKPLYGVRRRVLPDRIETATYLAMTAACGGDITLERTDASLLEPVLTVLKRAGCELDAWCDTIRLRSDGALRGVEEIRAETYPGFPTDAQAPVTAALLCADGRSVIEDAVFPGRFLHVPELQKFGADIRTDGNRAVVHGVKALSPATVQATDLRGGAGVLIAALRANGESRILNAELLRRGYAEPDAALQKLGAEVCFA